MTSFSRYVSFIIEYGRDEVSEVHAAQSDIKEDLHAAELKYTVLNVFNVMVLI